jgi:hypothetical protein
VEDRCQHAVAQARLELTRRSHDPQLSPGLGL